MSFAVFCERVSYLGTHERNFAFKMNIVKLTFS